MFKKLLLSVLISISLALPSYSETIRPVVGPAVYDAVWSVDSYGGAELGNIVLLDLSNTADLNTFLTDYSGSYTRTGSMFAFDFEGLLKESSANVLPVYGGRCVTNLLTYSQDISNADWTKIAGVTITGTDKFQADSANDSCYETITSKDSHEYVLSFDAYVITPLGQLSGYAFSHTYSETGNYTTLTLTRTLQRYSVKILGTSGGGALRGGFQDRNTSAWAQVHLSNLQFEDVTGQADQNPSEYVATTTAAKTEWFNYENANTVSSNVVTEATGDPITVTHGGAFWPSVTNNFAVNIYRSFGSWSNHTATTTKDQVGVDGGSNLATTILDESAIAVSTVAQTFVIPDDSNWTSFSMLIKKDTDTTRFPSIELLMGTTAYYRERIVLNTQTGAVNETYAEGEYVVFDIGDWWMVTLSILNTGVGNTALYATITPAFNSDFSSSSSDVSATGSIIADWAQMVAARRAPIHLVVGGATLAAQDLHFENNKLIADSKGAIYAEMMLLPDNLSILNGSIVNNGQDVLYSKVSDNDISSNDGTNVLAFNNSLTGYEKVAGYWSGSVKQLSAGGSSSSEGAYDGAWGSGDIYVGNKSGLATSMNGIINQVQFYYKQPEDQTFWEAETVASP